MAVLVKSDKANVEKINNNEKPRKNIINQQIQMYKTTEFMRCIAFFFELSN